MPINDGRRCDGFKDKGVDYSNPIVKKYVHKQYVVKTGDGEDDFIIDEKPVLIEEFNVSKEIQKQAKGTDLKSLILQCTRTGDYSILDVNHGSFVDITGYPEDPIEAHNAILAGNDAYNKLPEGLKGKSIEELANMSSEDIAAYVKDVVSKNASSQVVEEKPKEEVVNNG